MASLRPSSTRRAGPPRPSCAPQLLEQAVSRRVPEPASAPLRPSEPLGPPPRGAYTMEQTFSHSRSRSRSRSRRQKHRRPPWESKLQSEEQQSWRDRHHRWGKQDKNDRQHWGCKRGYGQDIPKVMFAQGYISDVPVEWNEEAIRELHLKSGLSEDEAPISMKFLSSKADSTGDTCSIIARYKDDEVLQKAIIALSGRPVTCKSGREKTIGITKAKPAKWMVDAGLAPDADKFTPTRVTLSNIPSEITAVDILQMHKQYGLTVEDMPLVTIIAPKLPTDETCLVNCRYPDISNARRAVEKFRGALVATRSGTQRHIGARIEEKNEIQEARKKEAKDDLPPDVELEGMLETWNADQAYGFIKADRGGHELFAHLREFAGEHGLVPGTRFSFRAVFLPEREKYEARNCKVVSIPEALPELELEPVPEVQPPPDAESEPGGMIPGMDYFCEVWDLGKATGDWLGRLHPEVQQAVIDEYDDSGFTEPPENPDDQVFMEPSDNLFVTGLPKNFGQEALVRLFSRFGTVLKSKLLPPGLTALVQMKSAEETRLAVEDLNLHVPEGVESLLTVRYAPLGAREMRQSRPAGKTQAEEGDIPEGKTLLGAIKTWNPTQRIGFVAWNGSGPELPIAFSAFVDKPDLRVGVMVLFKAQWSVDLARYIVRTCMANPANVKAVLMACAGRGRCVREFARGVQKRLQKGVSEI